MTQKDVDVCGIGNGLVDILVRIEEAEFQRLGYPKASMHLVELAEQRKLLGGLRHHRPTMASGGSVANSIIALAQLGAATGFLCSLGDDEYGRLYIHEMNQFGIELGGELSEGEATGTVAILVTPDAERTMRTCLAVSARISAAHVDEELIARSKWLFVEGYLFANPEYGQEAIRQAVTFARANGTKIAVTLSESWVVEHFRPALDATLGDTALLFSNLNEARALTGLTQPQEVFAAIRTIAPNVVMTAGPDGAHISYEGTVQHVPAVRCDPLDLTGAGDMFAGAFLYGITQGTPPVDAARAACFLSSKVISQIGPRLHEGTRQFWEQCIER